MTTATAPSRALIVVYAAVMLDAIGIGIVFPILPRLIEHLIHSPDVAHYVGIVAALYSVMQFAFVPMLGALSDRIGRRPVMLLSLGGAAVDYLFLAMAPQLWVLMVGRAIAGITSANSSVATAYITDITLAADRAKRFGVMSAVFGAGFIIGPVLGGFLGDYWLRLPAIAAASLNGANFLLALFLLPETRKRSREPLDLSLLNPLRPLRDLAAFKGLAPVVLVYFLLSMAGDSYGTCWALWGADAFQWNGLWIGLSLAAFGVCQTLVQTFLPGPATRLLGERWATVVGIGCSCVALVAMAFAQHGWVIFAIMPIFALASLGIPAFQAFATEQVDADNQGKLQGVLAAFVSLASVFAPLGFTSLYFLTEKTWPGAIWLWVVVINLIAIPLVLFSTRASRRRAAA